MKKKLKIIIPIVVLVLIGGFLILSFNNIDSTIQTTTIFKGTFTNKTSVIASVNSDTHFVYGYQGISDYYVQIGQYVNKKDDLFSCFINNNKVKIKSEYTGYISQIDSNGVYINSNDYYIESYINKEKLHYLDNDTKALFICDEAVYNVSLQFKSNIITYINNAGLYKVIFKIEDDYSNLTLFEKGKIEFEYSQIEGLLVKKEALLVDSNGYYLLRSNFIKNLNIDSNRINVKLLQTNDEYALISGIGLENESVCIVDETIRSIIDD